MISGPDDPRTRSQQTAATLLAEARVILLDFDGPVCGLFARHRAPAIAADLRRLLTGRGVALTGDLAAGSDPLDVLRWTGRLGRRPLTRAVDHALTAAELTAARSAEPTPYAGEFITAAARAGRRLAVVSNNSADACLAYLTDHGLRQYIGPVIGRAFAEPTRMKPHPAPVLAAIAALHAEPGECVLIGDSPGDITAAHAAGVRAIGYAARPAKEAGLAGAEAVVSSMAELVRAIAADER